MPPSRCLNSTRRHSADPYCRAHDLVLGATVTGAELHYGADSVISFNIVVSNRASGAESTTGPGPTNLVQYVQDLPVVPGGQFGVQNLPTNPSVGSTLPGYSQSVSICTDEIMTVGSVRLTHTNP